MWKWIWVRFWRNFAGDGVAEGWKRNFPEKFRNVSGKTLYVRFWRKFARDGVYGGVETVELPERNTRRGRNGGIELRTEFRKNRKNYGFPENFRNAPGDSIPNTPPPSGGIAGEGLWW